MKNSHQKGTCGCCDGISVDTPMEVTNRSGLSAISYRIGRHYDFKKSLLAKLTTSKLEGLQQLTSRSDDDFTIALLDAFSTIADVLTFYQEQIANESFLRTYRELLSGQELAYLIGYHPRPGVAASTYLAFTLDSNTVLPSKEAERGMRTAENDFPHVVVPVGTKVQSVPEQDELPQYFETIEEIAAKADWNAISVKTTIPQSEITTRRAIYINGTNNNLRIGEQLLLWEENKGEIKTVLKKIEMMEVDEVHNHTKVYLQQSKHHYIDKTEIFKSEHAPTYKKELTDFINKPIGSANFKANFYNNIFTPKEAKKVMSTLKFPLAESGILVFSETANLFGYNAPSKRRYISGGKMKETNWKFIVSNRIIYLDRIYPGIVAGENGYLGLKIGNDEINIYKIRKVENVSLSRYGITGKATRIELNRDSGVNNIDDLRKTIVYVKSDRLPLSEEPIDSLPSKETREIDSLPSKETREIDLAGYYPELKPGKNIIISGELLDLPGVVRSEVHVLESVAKKKDFTYSTITLKKSLGNYFVRDTVRINANVALATHGESVQEVLGSGNGGASFQKFKLKQNPLTYISSEDPSGAASTLEIRVNDILWERVDSFYGHKDDESIYTLRQNSSGESIVTFGDGITGSRLPTGNQNIRAIYRKGIGADGMLQANQLSQLVSRHMHLKAVNNPVAPSGAQDPESISAIRRNANLTIFTLDRIVSLQDFEDFTRAYAGISKAKATWVWQGSSKVVHITIAGEGGLKVPKESLLYTNLKESIIKSLSQKTPFTLENYRPKYFTFTGSLKVDSRYEFEKVHQEVMDSIRRHYSFENREFGQSVALSELLGIIHGIDGVLAVDIDSLNSISVNSSGPIPSNQPSKLLVAALAEKGSETADPAELLLITDEPIQLNEMT